MPKLPAFLSKLLTDPKWWFAIYVIAQAIVNHYLPNFPPTILTAIDGLVAITLAAMAGTGAFQAHRDAQASRSAEHDVDTGL